MYRQTIPRFGAQRGAVLIVALVLLLVLTVLGTASMRDTSMEERMAGNFRDHNAALQAAETALRTGEEGIANATTFGSLLFDGTDGTYIVLSTSSSVDPQTAGNYGQTVPSSVLTDSNGKQLVSAMPEYYIEQLPDIELQGSDISEGAGPPVTLHFYRVTAKGYGISPKTEVLLQSTYFHWNGH